jgi:adenosine deaminase
MRSGYVFRDLTSFLAAYYEGMSVLRGEQDFYDLAMAYFRTASAQHVVYADVFFDPQAHTSRGIGFDTVIAGLAQLARNSFQIAWLTPADRTPYLAALDTYLR